jgi:hypothetical protein
MCSCPTQVVDNRPPTQAEFLQVYESAVTRLLDELICITTLFGGVDPCPTQAQVNCTFDLLTTTLESQIVVPTDDNPVS